MKLETLVVVATFIGPCSGPRSEALDGQATSPQVSAPVAPASSPPPSIAVLGDYACTHDTWVGAMPNRQRQSTPVGYVKLVDGQTYRWQDNGGSGKYSVDPSGVVTWIDGPIADKKPKKSTYRKNVKTTQIDIVFADGFDWSCGHNL